MRKYKIVCIGGVRQVALTDDSCLLVGSLDINKYGYTASLRAPSPIEGEDSIYFYGAGATPEESIENAIRASERLHTAALSALDDLAEKMGIETERKKIAELEHKIKCAVHGYASPEEIISSFFESRKEIEK